MCFHVPVYDEAELCRLHFNGMAKSLVKQSWLCRCILANPKPNKLKNTRQGFHGFFEPAGTRVPMSFQVLGVQDFTHWYRWINNLKLTAPPELDFKD